MNYAYTYDAETVRRITELQNALNDINASVDDALLGGPCRDDLTSEWAQEAGQVPHVSEFEHYYLSIIGPAHTLGWALKNSEAGIHVTEQQQGDARTVLAQVCRDVVVSTAATTALATEHMGSVPQMSEWVALVSAATAYADGVFGPLAA